MSVLSTIRTNPSALRRTSWKEYGIRFAFGGIVTVVIGIIGKAFGPTVAGLFLAFPAILPASLTLLASHEGDKAAGLDAFGAMVGSIGLAAFGIVVWILGARWPAIGVLLLAACVWFVVAASVWFVAVTERRAARS